MLLLAAAAGTDTDDACCCLLLLAVAVSARCCLAPHLPVAGSANAADAEYSNIPPAVSYAHISVYSSINRKPNVTQR
jgi:hypothetical protein